MQRIVLEPLFTEKTLQLAGNGWFTFKVAKEATKRDIADHINDQFKVHVQEVRTEIMKGKTRRTGKRRIVTRIHSWKKAMVRLAKNEKIDLFTIPETESSKKSRPKLVSGSK